MDHGDGETSIATLIVCFGCSSSENVGWMHHVWESWRGNRSDEKKRVNVNKSCFKEILSLHLRSIINL